ncbi:hypothetical protein [uncultured Streptococcus sp.]|uniref:hypothetical protein n=1 Tax=uncultured Streptococcus sp. TaxID=83427 RepID=UPI0025F1BAAB|nr:hypothetical protein [uncultured Streptococcus sp.]
MLLVTNGLFVYQLFKLVQLDASVRGMKYPGFWAFLRLADSLNLYLLKRDKAIFSMTAEEKEELETRKKRLLYLLVLILLSGIFPLTVSLSDLKEISLT